MKSSYDPTDRFLGYNPLWCYHENPSGIFYKQERPIYYDHYQDHEHARWDDLQSSVHYHQVHKRNQPRPRYPSKEEFDWVKAEVDALLDGFRELKTSMNDKHKGLMQILGKYKEKEHTKEVLTNDNEVPDPDLSLSEVVDHVEGDLGDDDQHMEATLSQTKKISTAQIFCKSGASRSHEGHAQQLVKRFGEPLVDTHFLGERRDDPFTLWDSGPQFLQQSEAR
ncbi:hypothetical protein QQ045_009205 [Rhodiola kirilowii]